jgi:hypothetical protein
MRIHALLVVCSFLLLVPLLLGCSGNDPLGIKPKGSIQGGVKDDQGNTLKNVQVIAGGVKTTTDTYGTFRLDNVVVGQVTVSVSLSGYADIGQGSKVVQVSEGNIASTGYLVIVPVNNETGTSTPGVYLWHISPNNTEFDGHGQSTLNATVYYNSLKGNMYRGNTESATYSLGRHYKRFTSVVGTSDFGTDANAQFVFRLIGDGTQIYQSPQVSRGNPVSVDVSVENVLTLDLEVSWVQNTGGTSSQNYSWGDAWLSLQ